MLLKRHIHSLVFKAVSIILLQAFLVSNIVWAYPETNNPTKATLAAYTNITEDEFKEMFRSKEFLLAKEGTYEYIRTQVDTEKKIFGKDWKNRRTEVVAINDLKTRGRIIYDVRGLHSVVLIRVAGLLSCTGQPAYVELDGEEEYKGMPTIYIDSMLTNTPDKAIQRHEIDEILQWENLRVNILHIKSRESMYKWIVRNIDELDPDDDISRRLLEESEYADCNSSRAIAKKIHKKSYPLDSLYDEKYVASLDFDYAYINTMLSLYGTGNKSRHLNIAAHAQPDEGNVGKSPSIGTPAKEDEKSPEGKKPYKITKLTLWEKLRCFFTKKPIDNIDLALRLGTATWVAFFILKSMTVLLKFNNTGTISTPSLVILGGLLVVLPITTFHSFKVIAWKFMALVILERLEKEFDSYYAEIKIYLEKMAGDEGIKDPKSFFDKMETYIEPLERMNHFIINNARSYFSLGTKPDRRLSNLNSQSVIVTSHMRNIQWMLKAFYQDKVVLDNMFGELYRRIDDLVRAAGETYIPESDIRKRFADLVDLLDKTILPTLEQVIEDGGRSYNLDKNKWVSRLAQINEDVSEVKANIDFLDQENILIQQIALAKKIGTYFTELNQDAYLTSIKRVIGSLLYRCEQQAKYRFGSVDDDEKTSIKRQGPDGDTGGLVNQLISEAATAFNEGRYEDARSKAGEALALFDKFDSLQDKPEELSAFLDGLGPTGTDRSYFGDDERSQVEEILRRTEETLKPSPSLPDWHTQEWGAYLTNVGQKKHTEKARKALRLGDFIDNDKIPMTIHQLITIILDNNLGYLIKKVAGKVWMREEEWRLLFSILISRLEPGTPVTPPNLRDVAGGLVQIGPISQIAKKYNIPGIAIRAKRANSPKNPPDANKDKTSGRAVEKNVQLTAMSELVTELTYQAVAQDINERVAQGHDVPIFNKNAPHGRGHDLKPSFWMPIKKFRTVAPARYGIEPAIVMGQIEWIEKTKNDFHPGPASGGVEPRTIVSRILGLLKERSELTGLSARELLPYLEGVLEFVPEDKKLGYAEKALAEFESSNQNITTEKTSGRKDNFDKKKKPTPKHFDPLIKGKKRTGVSKWVLLGQLRVGLAKLSEETVSKLIETRSLGKRRGILIESGLGVAVAIDGKFLTQEIDKFLQQRPRTTTPATSTSKHHVLRYLGKGRQLIAYSNAEFDFVVKMPRNPDNLDLILRGWLGKGYNLAKERLNDLGTPTIVIDATDGTTKPFSYLLKNQGSQKTNLAIIQKKVIPVFERLKYFAKNGKISEAEDLVDAYKDFVVSLFKRGVMDFDFTYPYYNCGVDPRTGKIYMFDFGDLVGSESDIGMFFENLGVTNKYFYDDLKQQVSEVVARYFAMLPLSADDFFTKSGESLFGVDLKTENADSLRMSFPYNEKQIRAIFMNNSVSQVGDVASETLQDNTGSSQFGLGSGGVEPRTIVPRIVSLLNEHNELADLSAKELLPHFADILAAIPEERRLGYVEEALAELESGLTGSSTVIKGSGILAGYLIQVERSKNITGEVVKASIQEEKSGKWISEEQVVFQIKDPYMTIFLQQFTPNFPSKETGKYVEGRGRMLLRILLEQYDGCEILSVASEGLQKSCHLMKDYNFLTFIHDHDALAKIRREKMEFYRKSRSYAMIPRLEKNLHGWWQATKIYGRVPIRKTGALRVLNDFVPAKLKKGEVYKIRYNKTKFDEYQMNAGLSSKKNSPRALLQEYIDLLRMRAPKGSIKIIPCYRDDRPLISVSRYTSKDSAKPLGVGNVDMEGDIRGQPLRIIGMLNMAFAASHIPNDVSEGELHKYTSLLDFIRDQYKGITGKKLTAKNLLQAIRWIALPAAESIPVQTLEEYYRLTIEQLREAA